MEKLKQLKTSFVSKVKNPTRRFLVTLGIVTFMLISLAIILVACGDDGKSPQEEIPTETIETTSIAAEITTTAVTTVATSMETFTTPTATTTLDEVTESPETTTTSANITTPPVQVTQVTPRHTEPPTQQTQAPPPPTAPPPVITDPPPPQPSGHIFTVADLEELVSYGNDLGRFDRTRVTSAPGALFIVADGQPSLLLEITSSNPQALAVGRRQPDGSVIYYSSANSMEEAKEIIRNFS